MNKKTAFGIKLGLPEEQAASLAALRTPGQIQDFINEIPINFEEKGETNLTVLEALRQRRAHCLEGALIASCALWMQGPPPLLMNLQARDDDDHAVVLYRRKQFWGAISKSNHVWLRWRDPVYRSLRELALSYFHEYVMGPKKTLLAYSIPFDLRRFDPSLWVSGKDAWKVAIELAKTRRYRLLPYGLVGRIRQRDPIEVRAGKLLEYEPPKSMKRSSIEYLQVEGQTSEMHPIRRRAPG